MQSSLLAQQLEFLQLEANEARTREYNLQELNERLLSLISQPEVESSNLDMVKSLNDRVEDLEIQLSGRNLDLEALRNSKDAEITKLHDKIIQLEATNRALKYDLDRFHKIQEDTLKFAEERYKTELKLTQDSYEELLSENRTETDNCLTDMKAKLSATTKFYASENGSLKVKLDQMKESLAKLQAENNLLTQENIENSSIENSFSELTTTFRKKSYRSHQGTEELVKQLQKRYGDAIEARNSLINQLKISNANLQKQVLHIKSDLTATSFQLAQIQFLMGDHSQTERERMLTDEVKKLIGKLIKAKNKLRAFGAVGALNRNRGLQESNLSDSHIRRQAESFAKSFDRSYYVL